MGWVASIHHQVYVCVFQVPATSTEDEFIKIKDEAEEEDIYHKVE